MNWCMWYESAGDEYVGPQFVVEFSLVRGLPRGVLILTSEMVESPIKRRGTVSLTIGYSAECKSFAVQNVFDTSNSVLQHLFSTGVGWMKTLMRTMPSAFLHSGLIQFLLQVVLS